jgi:hypothetical protein
VGNLTFITWRLCTHQLVFEGLHRLGDTVGIIPQILAHPVVDHHASLERVLHVLGVFLPKMLNNFSLSAASEKLTASSAPSWSHNWISPASFTTLVQTFWMTKMLLVKVIRATCPSFSSCVRAALIFSISSSRFLILFSSSRLLPSSTVVKYIRRH